MVSHEGDDDFDVVDKRKPDPILITNDARLYLVYKGVFTEKDFLLFCKIVDKEKTITEIDKEKFDRGNGTRTVYEYFSRIKRGEGSYVYQYTEFISWRDERGNLRSEPGDRHWTLQAKNPDNTTIKYRLNL